MRNSSAADAGAMNALISVLAASSGMAMQDLARFTAVFLRFDSSANRSCAIVRGRCWHDTIANFAGEVCLRSKSSMSHGQLPMRDAAHTGSSYRGSPSS
jgi:hypothetical protein